MINERVASASPPGSSSHSCLSRNEKPIDNFCRDGLHLHLLFRRLEGNKCVSTIIQRATFVLLGHTKDCCKLSHGFAWRGKNHQATTNDCVLSDDRYSVSGAECERQVRVRVRDIEVQRDSSKVVQPRRQKLSSGRTRQKFMRLIGLAPLCDMCTMDGLPLFILTFGTIFVFLDLWDFLLIILWWERIFDGIPE